MTTKKIQILIGLLVIVSFVLTSCAQPATPAPAEPPAASDAEEPEEPAKPAEPDIDLGGYDGPPLTTEPVTLRLMRQSFGPIQEQWWTDMYDEFKKAYPNITIEEEQVNYGELNEKLQTYVAAGDPPDIMMSKGDFISGLVYNDILLGYNTYLTQDYLDDIAPAVWSLQAIDGELYCMPWDQANIAMFFNKDIFDAAGVAYPSETADLDKGWTWEQTGESWEKLTNYLTPAGEEPTQWAKAPSEYGSGGPGSSYYLEGMYIRSMGDPDAAKDSSLYKTYIGVSDDGLTVSGYIDTPEAVEGATFYQSIFENKWSPLVAQPKMWEDGKAGTKYSSGGGVNRYNNPDYGIQHAWGVTPIPAGTNRFNHNSSDCLVMPKTAEHSAEAAAFLAFIHNDVNRLYWHDVWGSMPARASLFGMMDRCSQPQHDVICALTQISSSPPVTPGYLEYFNAMNAALNDIAFGSDPEERLHQAAQEIDELLAQYK